MAYVDATPFTASYYYFNLIRNAHSPHYGYNDTKIRRIRIISFARYTHRTASHIMYLGYRADWFI